MGIYTELLALLVSQESGIKTLPDIKGKRINVDVAGSGTRVTAEIVMDAMGVSTDDLALVSELKSTEGPNMLKDRKIDGYFGGFGHPTANIKDASTSVDSMIVPIEGPAITALTEKYPYYAKGLISGTFYKGTPNDTPSIGVKAVLVTSDKVSEEAVYTVTKAIVENFEDFKKLHPAYKTITKESLLEGTVAPLHPGAAKYYKEAGLLK
jgi:TRAP transporter TAXI family solute receptor